MALDMQAIRRQFPFLEHDQSSVYLDSAATAQKPRILVDALKDFYETSAANAHRGLHPLADSATQKYEDARKTIADFVHAKHSDEIVFTRNSTESLNLVAHTLGKQLTKGDRIILSIMEHHSNIVPWLQLKEEKGVEIIWIDIDSEGAIDMDAYDEALKEGAAIVTLSMQSNVLGVRPDAKRMVARAKQAGAITVIDAAQFAAHGSIDVADLDCDFLVFSAHKSYGPTGIGVLYGKRELLKHLPPFLGGGMMIREVNKEGFSAADAPQKFEAGTMPAAEAYAFAEVLKWLSQFPIADREAHERMLIERTSERLRSIDELTILGPTDPSKRFGCIAFGIEGVHPHDLADMLGQKNIAIRAGNHCAQPLHDRLGLNASARISVGIYNTIDEIDRAADAIEEITKKFHS